MAVKKREKRSLLDTLRSERGVFEGLRRIQDPSCPNCPMCHGFDEPGGNGRRNYVCYDTCTKVYADSEVCGLFQWAMEQAAEHWAKEGRRGN